MGTYECGNETRTIRESGLFEMCIRDRGDPHVLLTTSAGNIELELDKQKAPVSVQNFVDYVNSGFYNIQPSFVQRMLRTCPIMMALLALMPGTSLGRRPCEA